MARLNPILVRELRQAVRGRLVVGFFLVFLAIQMAATIIVMAGYVLATGAGSQGDRAFGSSLFGTLLGVLLVACLWFVPLYSGVRLAMENSAANVDLYFITTLTPGQVIRGKLTIASAIILVAFSAAAPFLAMSIFLRGVDVLTVVYSLVVLFAVILLATQAGLFIGSMHTRAARGCFGLSGLGCLGIVTMIGTAVVGVLAVEGASAMFGDPGPIIFFTVFGIIAFLVLHGLSIAMVGPRQAPRDAPDWYALQRSEAANTPPQDSDEGNKG